MQVCNEILDQNSIISWEDIAGQDHAKRLVQEMVVWPILNPQLFRVRACQGGMCWGHSWSRCVHAARLA